MYANGTGSLVFIDDVTADKSSVSGNIICSYSAKCFRTHRTAFHSADGQWPEAYCEKQPKSFLRQRSEMLCNGKVNHLTWIRLSMHFTCWRQNGSCSGGLAEHHQGWNPASGDVHAFQTSGCNWLKDLQPSIKKWKFDFVNLSHYFWSLKKWEAQIQTFVIPTTFTWFVVKSGDVNTLKLKLKVCS